MNFISETTDFILVYRRNKQKYHFNVLLRLPQHPPLPPKIKQRKKRKKDRDFDRFELLKEEEQVKTPPLASNLDSFVGIKCALIRQ